MTSLATDSLSEIVQRLDDRIRQVDEERWLSSRYAAKTDRDALVSLYAFCYELARVRIVVSETGLGQIRFQWWRDALAEMEQGKPRQHDVVLLLDQQVKANRLKIASLQELVDQYETSFLEQDRSKEPEAYLAALAASLFAPVHSYGQTIRSIAPAWAALRRGEAVEIGETVRKLPSSIRPALAHFRLRRAWSRKIYPGPIRRRVSILLAAMTGSI